MKNLSALSATAALVITSFAGLGAAPASAQWGSGYYGGGYYGGGYGGGYYGRHRHRDRVDIGDIIGTVLVVGAVATVINQVGKIGERDRDYDRRYDRRDRRSQDYDDRYDGRDGGRYGDRNYAPQRSYRDKRSDRGAQATEDRAADACSWAAEGQAGEGAQVERITGVRQDGQGWRVDGTLRQAGRNDSFTCGYTNGRVDFVQLGGTLSVR